MKTETAPLLATAAAPVPAGGAAEWFHGAGGAKLRAALFPAKGAPIGSVVLSSGRTEPIEKYFETVEDLRARGLTVLVQEWRGQGLSHRELKDRLAGHASGYQTFLNDYRALLAHFGPRLPNGHATLVFASDDNFGKGQVTQFLLFEVLP